MTSTIKNHPLHYSIYTRACAKDVFDMLSLKQGMRLLDIGCGIGYFLWRIDSSKQKIHLHGIEYDLNSISYLPKKVNGNFINGDATQLPYQDNSFDSVIGVSVLEHLSDDERMIGETVRVCKNGGEIIISVPSKDGIRSYSKLRNLGHTDPENVEYHYRIGYSKEELISLLSKYGISIEDIRYSLILTAEIFMDIVKAVYFKFNKLKSQSNIVAAKDSFIFKIYKLCIPAVLSVEYLEKWILRRWIKGHIITVRGKIRKVD